MAPTKEEIKKQDIVDHLTWDHSVNANDVQVTVHDSTVQLRGTVPNQTAKMAAERDTYQVNGVARVENFLVVEFPPSITIPGDEEIAGNVRNILEWDSRLESGQVEVSVRKGIVRLTGTVASYWEKRRAYEIALSISGVVSVTNRLTVSPAQSIIDRDIEEDIRNAFRRSVLVDEDRIEVRVENGIAHLAGVVSNHLIRQEIHNVAMYTRGILDVDDTELTIG